MQSLGLSLEEFLRQLWKGQCITSGMQGRQRQIGQSPWTGLYQCAISYAVRVEAAAGALFPMFNTRSVKNHGAAAVSTSRKQPVGTQASISVALMARSPVIFGVLNTCSWRNVYSGTQSRAGVAIDGDNIFSWQSPYMPLSGVLNKACMKALPSFFSTT